MDILPLLPPLQAGLNSISALFLVTGYVFIRRQNRAAHRLCMSMALLVSTLFMISYLYYHSRVGNVAFAGQGAIRPLYFTILASHVLLAAVIVPLVLMTVWRILRGQTERHRRLARWTLPLWLYVSVTGVTIYIMAFHLYPPQSGTIISPDSPVQSSR